MFCGYSSFTIFLSLFRAVSTLLLLLFWFWIVFASIGLYLKIVMWTQLWWVNSRESKHWRDWFILHAKRKSGNGRGVSRRFSWKGFQSQLKTAAQIALFEIFVSADFKRFSSCFVSFHFVSFPLSSTDFQWLHRLEHKLLSNSFYTCFQSLVKAKRLY